MMPLLDGLRSHNDVAGSVSRDVSHVEDIHTESVGNGSGNHGARRQKIVVVGLGMVAISFMLVFYMEYTTMVC